MAFLRQKIISWTRRTTRCFHFNVKLIFFNLPIDLQLDLFNKMIKPILSYECKLWGFGNIDTIERVQLKFLKQLLNLKKSTLSFIVYGELGAKSNQILYYIQVSKANNM